MDPRDEVYKTDPYHLRHGVPQAESFGVNKAGQKIGEVEEQVARLSGLIKELALETARLNDRLNGVMRSAAPQEEEEASGKSQIGHTSLGARLRESAQGIVACLDRIRGMQDRLEL